MPAQEKIRVIVVDDIADTRENLKRLLQFDQMIECVGAAKSGREAIEMAQQLKPDVVIMDINMPDIDGITATETIRRKMPFTQVVILSVQSDASYMRRAMLAGARDFLTKPPMIDDLTAAIRRAGAMAADDRSKQAFPVGPTSGGGPTPIPGNTVHHLGKIIVIYSPKGGTGKTTIAANLAIALHSEETKAIVVDGNVQFGDVAVFFNEQVKNTLLDVITRSDELDGDLVEEVAVKHNTTGVRILAAPPKPELADQIDGERFGKLLEFLKQVYSYIIIDTASYLTEVVQSALDVADLIVLLTTQDIPSIKNANSFLLLADNSGIKRDRILFVMNRYDKRVSISPERVGESLRQEILVSVPFEERIVSASVNRGIPFYMENKAQPIGKSIAALADLVREKLAKLQEGRSEITGKK